MIEVINISRCKDFGKRIGDIYIGREFRNFPGSAWANPFHISSRESRDTVLDKYEIYIEQRIDMGEVNISDLLNAKRLGCWCSPERCHGDYLAKKIEQLKGVKDGAQTQN
jgi:hypothetical protein